MVISIVMSNSMMMMMRKMLVPGGLCGGPCKERRSAEGFERLNIMFTEKDRMMKFWNCQHPGLEIRACPTEGLHDRTLRRQVPIEEDRGGRWCSQSLHPTPNTPWLVLPCLLWLLNTEQCLWRFFNTAMDQLRVEFNKEGQRVVFVATSDDFHWIKKHLVDKQAKIYFRDLDFKSMSDQAWHTCWKQIAGPFLPSWACASQPSTASKQ